MKLLSLLLVAATFGSIASANTSVDRKPNDVRVRQEPSHGLPCEAAGNFSRFLQTAATQSAVGNTTTETYK